MSTVKLKKIIFDQVNSNLKSSYIIQNLHRQSQEKVLKNCYTVVHLNGKNFENFSTVHSFDKPNDKRAKELMDFCAKNIMQELRPHIILSYGFLDQFSFVVNKSSSFCDRDLIKIVSSITSSFTSQYIFNWKKFFKSELIYPPSFNAISILIQNEKILEKFIQNKQYECYLTSLYDTAFHAMTGTYKRYSIDCEKNSYKIESLNQEKKLLPEEAKIVLLTEVNSISKINEFLFKNYSINYNNELELFKKGTFNYFKEESIDSLNIKLNENFFKKFNYNYFNLIETC